MRTLTRRPRPTIRLRLTALYGGLFLVSGAALLTVTYLLVRAATGPQVLVGTRIAGGPSNTVTDPTDPGFGGALQIQADVQHATMLHSMLVWSGVALALMSVLSVWLGWLVAGRVLRPLREMTASVRAVSANSLHRRLAPAGPDDELKELGETFDALLERLQAAFQAQRRFVANASHELRTPLARQRALGQVVLDDPDASIGSLRAAHERVLAAGAEQERILDALLTLARGQAGPDRSERFDLAEVVALGVETRRVDCGVTLDLRLGPAPVTGDPRLIERLVANLVENAVRHNVPDGTVLIETGVRGGGTVLGVHNTGPVVPADAIHRIFQPFRRLGADRTGGSGGVGLGLSIVSAIAASHRATVRARPRTGGGLDIEVAFPG